MSIYHVAKTGNDGNGGTSLIDAVLTITKGVSLATNPGDIIYVHSGTYNERVVLDPYGGSGSLFITLSAFPGDSVVVDGNSISVPADEGLIDILVSRFIVKDIEVVNSMSIGIRGWYFSRQQIINCTIHDSQSSGVIIGGNSGSCIVDECTIYNNCLNNEDAKNSSWGSGISIIGTADGLCANSVIKNCTVYNNWGEGISTFGGSGSGYKSNLVTIQDNISYNNFAPQIYISDADNTTCQRNIVYCTSGNSRHVTDVSTSSQQGIYLADEQGGSVHSSGQTVINNLVAGCENNFRTDGGAWTNTLIANNTFVNAMNDDYPDAVVINGGTHTNFIFKNNLTLQETGSISDYASSTGTTFDYNLWSKTPSVGLGGANDVIGDPFVTKSGSFTPGSLTKEYFRALTDSPAKNAGTTIAAVTADYEGTVRPITTTYDIGAFEATASTVTREGTIKKSGTYAVKLTNGLNQDAVLYQNMYTALGGVLSRGRSVTLFMWVYATVASRVQIRIKDGGDIETAYSSYHTGSSTYELLSVTKTISSDATYVYVEPYITLGSVVSGYFDLASTVATTVTPGLVAYSAISSTNLTSEKASHFWVYSSVALLAGDMQLLLDDTNACASPLESLDIPAVAANTWTPICVDFATPANLTAIRSIGLKVVGALPTMQFYIDDVQSVTPFTGTVDDQFSMTSMIDHAIITNGIDQPQDFQLDTTTRLVDATTTLNAGSISASDIVIAFKDHLLYFNNIENGGTCFQRCSWSNIGSITDFINGTAGYQDITGDDNPIIAARIYMENRVVIYKTDSITVCEWVGGQTPFRFTNMLRGYGALSKESVLDFEGVQMVMGVNSIYKYAGWVTVEEIDAQNHKLAYSTFNRTYVGRVFCYNDKANTELEFWFPCYTEYPDVIWATEVKDKSWYRKNRTMTGFMHYSSQATLTIGDLIGTIGDQNYRIGDNTTRSNTPIILYGDANGKVYWRTKTTSNDNGAAITNEFQTPDFTDLKANKLTDTQSDGWLSNFWRCQQLLVEAKGQSITCDFSTDGGSSWSPCGGSNTQALNSNYNIYQFDFDSVHRKIRFRFRNTSVSSGFTFRYYSFNYHERSTRR